MFVFTGLGLYLTSVGFTPARASDLESLPEGPCTQ